MVESVITIGSILAFIVVVLGLISVRATKEGNEAIYYPSFFLFVAGLTFLTLSSMMDKEFIGAPLGGWGIACMFSAAIGFIFTSLFDSYKNTKTIES